MARFAMLFALCFLCLISVSLSGPIRRASGIPYLSGLAVDMTSGAGGTYPRANFLSNGNILGAYTAFSNGNNVLTLSTSTNNGASWAFTGTAATRPSISCDLDNPYPLQLPSGRTLLAYRNHDKDPVSGNYTFFRITISYSDDSGATWAYLSTPASDPGEPNGNWEPFLRNAQDGSLQLYYSRENSAADQDSLMRTSTDGGVTWSTATTISGEDITARDGMLGVATVSGSNVIAVFESEQNGYFTIKSITSTDDGATWGNRQLVYTPTGTNTNANAPQVVNVGGTMCVSFMTNEDTQGQQAGAKLVTSIDGGTTWGNKIEVFQPQTNWPGLLDLNGSSFLYMADNNGAKSQEVIVG
ncbi:hypothetical protein MMC18_001375 [Xylographa bjoerkii]|nr:hypothetical protein [Xylographa bjoerkii]